MSGRWLRPPLPPFAYPSPLSTSIPPPSPTPSEERVIQLFFNHLLSHCSYTHLKEDEHDEDEMTDKEHDVEHDEEHNEEHEEMAEEEDDEISDEEDDDIPDEEEYEISDGGDENDERDGEGQDFDTDQESKTSSFRLQISSINKNELLTMTNCIVNTNQLLQLAQAPVITTCNKDECRSRVKIEQKYYGTRVVLQWVTIISSD